MDDPHGDCDATDEDSESIHTGGEEDRMASLEGIGIDHRRDGVRCIMESIDKLECTHEKETESKRDIDDFHREDE